MQNKVLPSNMKGPALVGCLCALGCETFFGLGYVFTKQATGQVSALELLGWRFLIAFVVMTLLFVVGLVKINLRGKKIGQLLFIAFLCPVIYFIAETFGISRTSASESGVFLACIPVASLIASTLILKKKPNKWQMIGIAITLAGVIVTVVAAGMSTSLSIPGYLFLTGAIISYALYTVFVERATDFTEQEITYVMLAAGALVFVVSALAQAMATGSVTHLLTLPLQNRSFLIAIIYQGIGCSILAFFLNNMAITRIGVNKAASFIGVSTVVSIIAGVLVMKENISALQIIGAAVILAGVYTANHKVK